MFKGFELVLGILVKFAKKNFFFAEKNLIQTIENTKRSYRQFEITLKK